MKQIYWLLKLQSLFLLCMCCSIAMRSFSKGSWVGGSIFCLIALSLLIASGKDNKTHYYFWFLTKINKAYHYLAIGLLTALIVAIWLEEGFGLFAVSSSGAFGVGIVLHGLFLKSNKRELK